MGLKIIKHQRGYLLIVAILLIVVIGFIGTLLTNMYTVAARAGTNILQSDQALYIAKAGLEIARRDLMKSGSTLLCNDINSSNSKYTNACYPPGASNCLGYFTVTGVAPNQPPSPSLATAITDTISTTVNLSSISGLLSSGIVVIDSEAIWYSGISGTQLQNVDRGAFGTTAKSHAVNANIFQNTCTLTSTAGVPSLSNPTDTAGKRVVQDLLWKSSGSGGLGSLPNGMIPGLVGKQTVNLSGSSKVHNTTVPLSNVNSYPGSTVVSGGVTINGSSAQTQLANNATASVQGNFLADVNINSTINNSAFWNYFFSQSKDELKNDPSTIIVPRVQDITSYDFLPGKNYWVDCDNFNFTGNKTIGSAENPGRLVINCNVNLSGNLIVYGFLYVTQGFSVTGSAEVHGAVAAENAVNLNGSADIYFDPEILTTLNLLQPSKYNKYYVSQEVFK